jgi:hypothetical protein
MWHRSRSGRVGLGARRAGNRAGSPATGRIAHGATGMDRYQAAFV